MANCGELRPHGADAAAAGAQAGAATVPKSELTVHIRIHHAVLAPDDVATGCDSSSPWRRSYRRSIGWWPAVVVVGITGKVRERHSILQLTRNRALAIEGYDIAGERPRPAAVRIAGVRVVDLRL